MASRMLLQGTKAFGREVGKEALALTKDVGKELAKEVGPEYIKQRLEEKFGSTKSEGYKAAYNIAIQGLKFIGTAKSVRGGPATHMIGQHRKDIVKNAVSQFLHPPKPNEAAAEKPEVGVLADILKRKPHQSFAALRVAPKDCSVLHDFNRGEFYVCKKSDSSVRECTYIHSTSAGELATVVESHKECLTDALPIHDRKCTQKSVRDLPKGYSIYNCADEMQPISVKQLLVKESTPTKMQGGRGRRHTRKRGHGARRKGTRKH
jgi:hypothetical protein